MGALCARRAVVAEVAVAETATPVDTPALPPPVVGREQVTGGSEEGAVVDYSDDSSDNWGNWTVNGLVQGEDTAGQ